MSDVRLKCEAFLSGGSIPRRHAVHGGNVSPSLRWEYVPESIAELALIVESVDKKSKESFVHWIMYKISPDEHGIPEGIPPLARLEEPFGAMHGKNSWGESGYRGPLDGGQREYRFRLFLLNNELSVGANLDKEGFLKAIARYVVDVAEITAVYEG